jgi:hypothetical protein
MSKQETLLEELNKMEFKDVFYLYLEAKKFNPEEIDLLPISVFMAIEEAGESIKHSFANRVIRNSLKR